MYTITAGVNGTNRTIDIHLEAEQTKADKTVYDAVKWVYETKGKFHLQDTQDPPQDIPFDSLTNSQRLRIYLEAIVWYTKQWAKNTYNLEQLPPAQATIETEAEAIYDIG